MNRTLLILVATAAAALAGCAATGPSNPISGPSTATAGSEAFSDQDFAWSTQSGGDGIDGFLTYKGGVSRFSCSSSPVILTPETPWSRARMMVLYGSGSQAAVLAADVRARTPPEHSSDYQKYARRTTCDSANHFSFSGLPDGAWYVITVATPVGDSGQTEGGGGQVAIMHRVETRGGVRHIRAGVSLKRMPGFTVRTDPACGCSYTVKFSLATTSGSVKSVS